MTLRYGKSAIDETVAQTFVPGGVADAGIRPAVVARAYRTLDPVHREILTETVFRERSVNEAAATLGLPVDVVKVRVYQALRALRAALD
ncbi:sigma factor-like helix-turn-helix DNA-binding protein [Spirillospora sp. NPDC048911]|uniref:sigma factor-like helix-turn-helix DNA-binding protein n=1 Tax=Spirillospora sp. NPDC048911 TaxID=3364527 RepID=UPI0037126B2D